MINFNRLIKISDSEYFFFESKTSPDRIRALENLEFL